MYQAPQAPIQNPNMPQPAGPNLGPVFTPFDATTGRLHRKAEKLFHLEDIQEAYTNLGQIALGAAGIEQNFKPSEVARGPITKAIHRRREREIARDSVTLEQYRPIAEDLEAGRQFIHDFMQEKRDKATDAARVAHHTGTTTREVLMDLKATMMTAKEKERTVGGEYMRPLTSTERRSVKKATKKAYKAGTISRVEYNERLSGLKSREVLSLPDDPVTRIERKARATVGKWEAAIDHKTESGAAATVRKARINRLRKKVTKRNHGIPVERIPVPTPNTQPTQTPNIVAPQTQEQLRRNQLKNIMENAAIGVSGWITGWDIPINQRIGKSVDSFVPAGTSVEAMAHAQNGSTKPEMLQQYQNEGITEVVTVRPTHEKLKTFAADSAKGDEAMTIITFETTNRGEADPATKDKYKYTVDGKENCELRVHLFLAASDATDLMTAVSHQPEVIREAIDVAMHERIGATTSWWGGGLRPPYDEWKQANHGVNRIAVRGGLDVPPAASAILEF